MITVKRYLNVAYFSHKKFPHHHLMMSFLFIICLRDSTTINTTTNATINTTNNTIVKSDHQIRDQIMRASSSFIINLNCRKIQFKCIDRASYYFLKNGSQWYRLAHGDNHVWCMASKISCWYFCRFALDTPP